MDNPFLDDNSLDVAAILGDAPRIASLLQQAAREGRAMSYSEILLHLGFRFTRPKMRTLCKTLDKVDREAIANEEPPLAVLVVREGDGLPGQGWWVGRQDYNGQWTGFEASAFVKKHQQRAFDYWRDR